MPTMAAVGDETDGATAARNRSADSAPRSRTRTPAVDCDAGSSETSASAALNRDCAVNVPLLPPPRRAVARRAGTWSGRAGWWLLLDPRGRPHRLSASPMSPRRPLVGAGDRRTVPENCVKDGRAGDDGRRLAPSARSTPKTENRCEQVRGNECGDGRRDDDGHDHGRDRAKLSRRIRIAVELASRCASIVCANGFKRRSRRRNELGAACVGLEVVAAFAAVAEEAGALSPAPGTHLGSHEAESKGTPRYGASMVTRSSHYTGNTFRWTEATTPSAPRPSASRAVGRGPWTERTGNANSARSFRHAEPLGARTHRTPATAHSDYAPCYSPATAVSGAGFPSRMGCDRRRGPSAPSGPGRGDAWRSWPRSRCRSSP